MLYFLQALLSPPVLGALAIFVLPWGIAALIDRRLDRTRRISGLPPVRIHAKTFLAVGYLLAFLGFIAFSVIPSLLDFTAKDKLLAANYAAKDVARCAEAFAEEADLREWDAPQTCIGRFSDTDTALAAHLHEQLGERYPADWYAVVFEDGNVVFALYSGHELTAADLHEPDAAAERKRLTKFGASSRDAIGFYENEE